MLENFQSFKKEERPWMVIRISRDKHKLCITSLVNNIKGVERERVAALGIKGVRGLRYFDVFLHKTQC